MRSFKKAGKKFISLLLSIVMVLSSAALGLSTIAHAENEWAYVKAYKYEPVTLYVKQLQLTSGQRYIFGVSASAYIMNTSFVGEEVSRKSKGTSDYYTKNDGSDVKYYADNYYIVDETNNYYRSNEYLWKNSKLYNESLKKYLTSDSSGALTLASSTSYTWSQTLDNDEKLHLMVNDKYLHLTSSGDSKTYNLYKNTATSNITVFAYQKITAYKKVVDEARTGYYLYNGQTVFNIPVGKTFDEALVTDGISVIYKETEDSENYQSLTVSDPAVSLKWNETVDTTQMGDYTATVYVCDTPVATLTVTVGEQGPVLVKISNDPSTSNLKSKFRGTSADDGKVLTDKTVQHNGDEYNAFATCADDEFSIELSALGQAYPIVETEETPEFEKIHPDVVFVIDASASMIEYNVSGDAGITRAEATAKALNAAIKSLYEADPETRIGIVTFNDNFNEMGVYLPLDKYTLPEGETNYMFFGKKKLAEQSASGDVTGTYEVRTTSSKVTATAATLSEIPISSANGINRPDNSELTYLTTSNGVEYYIGYYNKRIYVFRDGYNKRISEFKSSDDSSGTINEYYVDDNIRITRTGSGTDRGVSYVTYTYTPTTGTFDLTTTKISNAMSTNFLINSRGEVLRPNIYHFHYSCGTYTQAGLKAAENMFYEYAGTDLSHRIPTVVLVSDGIPTIGDPNTVNPCLVATQGVTQGYGYSDSSNVTSDGLSTLGLYTIKTGISVKQRVNSLYSQYWEEDSGNSTSFYSIGPGVDYPFGKTVLDPSEENLQLAYAETVSAGGESGNGVGRDLYNKIIGEFGSGLDYVDYVDWSYTGDLSDSDLTDAFVEITKSLIYVSRPLDTLESAENDMVKSKAAMIFTDTIGGGMELRDEPVLRYNNINFRPSNSETKTAGDSTVTTYTYNHKIKEVSSGKIYSLSDCLAEVITDPDGKQTVKWYISADLVPMICYDSENGVYDYIDAIRLIYKVGIADRNVVATYYANSTTEPANAEFYPVVGNPYYYDNVEGEDGKLHSVLKENETSKISKTSNPTNTLPNSTETTVNSNGTVSVILGNNGVESLKNTIVTVTKIWDDINNTYGARPDSITLQVYRNGYPYKEPVVINKSDVIIAKDSSGKDTWTYNIPNLPYEENVEYTVKEVNVDENYKPSYSDDTLTITNKIIETDVDIDKWAEGDKLESTGVAKVNLTATGVPTNFPVDVLFVTDLSNSMYWETGTSSYAVNGEEAKIDTLKNAFSEFADDFLSNNSSGSGYNNTISFVGFGGMDKDYLDNYDSVAKIKRYTDVTHTLFTCEEDVSAAKQMINDITYNYDDGNVYLTFDGTVAPVDSNKLGLAYGGTNYDHGFMEAYNAVQEIKQNYYEKTGESYDSSERQIYVLFITDGAPTHWNGKTYTGTPKDMTRPDSNAMWLNENGEKVRYSYMGVKQAGWYDYISTTPHYWATKVRNQNKVTGMSAIGIDMANGGFDKYVFTEESGFPLDVVIENIVDGDTVETLFADSSADLADDILSLASKVNGCGRDAYVIDTMGSQYDLQMASTVNCGIADSGTIALADYDMVPKITVSLYDTYKSTAVGTTINGVTVTNDMVGERTGSEPIVLETVTFSADGTQAFSDRLEGNIMKDGVIYAEHFTYNSNSYSVTLSDGTVLPAESFKWYIGYIPQNETELSYYVYLTGSMEGQRPEGIYDTNESAVLKYKDDFDVEHELVYPVPNLSWHEAKLAYELYLVDGNGTPVDESGNEVTFENRKVMSELAEVDIYLNTKTVIDYDELVRLLPDGYYIYSPEASYSATVSSDDTRSKSVIDDSTSTTKVFDPSTAVTGEDGTVNGITDYSFIKVAFAIARIEILPDVIVVDYGKTILCSPLDNDAGAISLEGVGAMDSDKYSDSYTSQNGVFRTEDNNVTFSPFSYMSSINRTRYYAKVANTAGGKEILNSTIYVIPATIVYYEDDFGGEAENGGVYIKYTGDWYTITDNGTKTEGVTANTDTDDRQDRGEVGQGHVPYGYDSSYDDCVQFSNGTASMATGKTVLVNGRPQSNATAGFTFTGTGFDIISRTDIDCGMITVVINKHETGEFYSSVPVINKGVNDLYQIPVISYEGAPYDTYDVIITVNAPSAFLGITGSNFYLDAIRIYNPMGLESDDNPEFDEANDAYNADKEANAFTQLIRNCLISVDDLDVTESYGAVYVDTLDNDYEKTGSGKIGNIKSPEFDPEEIRTRSIDFEKTQNFQLIGPNEEVYLSPGYGVGFIAESSVIPEAVHLEIKLPAPLNSEATLAAQTYGDVSTMKNITINSATEMYYDITDAVKFEKDGDVYKATVILSNGLPAAQDEGDIVAITNLKMTYSDDAVVNGGLQTSSIDTINVKAALKATRETYKQAYDTIYVQRIATTPNFDIVNAQADETASKGDTVILQFNTANSVDNVAVKAATGEEIDLTSLECEVDESKLYTDDFQNTKSWTATFTAVEEGKLNYTVEATAGEGEKADLTLSVMPARVVGLKLVRSPAKTNYNYGDRIDISGLVLEATYSDGSVKRVTSGFTLSTDKANHIGRKSVVISYQGFDVSYKINTRLNIVSLIKSLFSLFRK